MISSDEYGLRVTSRLEEYWAWFTPWHRRLWNPGSLAAIAELLEASESLPESAVKAFQKEVDRLTGPDPAIGDTATKKALGELLRTPIRYRADEWYQLAQLANRIEFGYIARWANLTRGSSKPGVERIARAVAGHLQHIGFSPTYLHRWLKYRTKVSTTTVSLNDVLEEAESDLVARTEREFRVVIPVLSAPDGPRTTSSYWRSAEDMASTIEAIQGTKSDVRHNGGFVLNISAKDQFAAVAVARDQVDRWDARAELATKKRVHRVDRVWIEGSAEPISFQPERREIEIGALSREDRLYSPLEDDPVSHRIDDALQLAQPMVAGSRSAAIGGGWASIEALLSDDADARAAARKMSAIVACSYPRAELTTLSYVHSKHGSDELAVKLRGETENVLRSRLVADAITAGQTLATRGQADSVAYERMKEVLTKSHDTLAKVSHYVNIAFNRLNRQRNLTLHGGKVSGRVRTDTLATAPALLGAGLDRVAHAWFVEGTRPFELAGRAELALQLVGQSPSPHPVELLEPAT